MYVDDILAISVDPDGILKEIQSRFKFKNDKIETPSNYLGAKLEVKEMNGYQCWTISSVKYVKAAIQSVEESLKKKSHKLPLKVTTPMTNNYLPKLDGTEELDEEDHTFYQELIGVL